MAAMAILRGLALLPALCLGGPSGGRTVTVERAATVPEPWRVRAPSHPEKLLELTFAVRQRNVDRLEAELRRVSDPRSPGYGDHLSSRAVHELVAPRRAHVDAVMDFLRQHGVQGRAATPNSDFIVADVPVAVAERMLSTEYVRLAHNRSGLEVDRAIGGYALPAEVAAAVDFVAPTTHVPSGAGQPRPVQQEEAGAGAVENVPKNLRQLYSVGGALGRADGNRQAVTAFLKQYFDEEALESFWAKYCDGITCGKGPPKLVGDATTGEPGIESMLDIETITGIAGNVESEFWGFSGNPPEAPENEPFVKWLAVASNTSDEEIPRIFSTSYGEDESSWSTATAERMNTEFMKAGVRGISIIFASGDSGANCKGGKFLPLMPASSPYVTTVGGTRPAAGFPAPGAESAIGLSSGGFSNYWATPDWQRQAVAAYLQQPGVPRQSERGYNVSGRAFPDISAQATGFCVTPFGCGVAGTSCACPAAAGVFGLLNDLRLQAGKSSLGFLNPLLYQHPEALNDITTGASDGCLLAGGWPATEGWDAVTGLGTPNYAKLAAVVAGLPGPVPSWRRGGRAGQETKILV